MKAIFFSGLILLISCHNTTKTDPVIAKDLNYFEAIKTNDNDLQNPQPGEWLYEHSEKGQTFEQYKKANPLKPDSERFIIYLKPIGKFTSLQKEVLKLTREYLEIFFQQKTKLLDPISDNIVPDSARRKRGNESTQLLAPFILNKILKGKIPQNGIALMAVSEKDLFPKPEWNYVFGLASYVERVGVTSIYRLQNERLDSTNFTLCLTRLINISSHEIGHMFTMHHCINAKCTMNGTNSLQETDLSPNRLCSECQKKLFWNIQFNNRKRLQELSLFFKKHNLESDYYLSTKDLDKFK